MYVSVCVCVCVCECVCVCVCLCYVVAFLLLLLSNEATSAVLFNSSIGDWFRTTVGVRQGCLLPPTLLNIFLERINTTDSLEDHEGTVSIGGRTITNLRFVDDIGGLISN